MKTYEVVLSHAQYAKTMRIFIGAGLDWSPGEEDPYYKDGIFSLPMSNDEYTRNMEAMIGTGLYKPGDPEGNKTAAFMKISEFAFFALGKCPHRK